MNGLPVIRIIEHPGFLAGTIMLSLAAIVATAILAKPETYLVGGGRDPDVPRL